MHEREKRPHLNQEQADFFSRAMEAYAAVKGTEAAADFFGPINQQLEGKEVLVATHKTASRFLDKYIAECPVESLHHLLLAFSKHMSDLCFDANASHSVENLFIQCAQFIDNKDFKPSFQELFASILGELKSYAPDLSEDRYGSHVIRSLITHYGGFKSMNQHIDKLCRQIIQAMLKTPDYTRSPHFSAVLQTICTLESDKYPKLINYLARSVPFTFDSIRDKSSSHLIEEILKLNVDEPKKVLFDNVFKTDALKCARDRQANFVLQRFLENTPKDFIPELCDQLLPNFASLLDERPEVINSLVSACARLKFNQDKIAQELNKYRNNRNLIDSLLSIRSQKAGAMILQSVCRFEQKQADPIVGAILDMTDDRFKGLCLDKNGSYIITEFLKSQTIKPGAKNKVIRKMLPILPEISANRIGSYIVEDAFKAGDMNSKVDICERLIEAQMKDKAPNVWRSLRVDAYMNRRGQWEHEITTAAKVEKAMKEFVDDPVAPANDK
ncbi:Pumilio-family RNA binding repeat containing protein [Trichomonas vaginalis G3]|uniref:Pumilio-family RNA binding repeat containing protein n=1 Tax=Trichomonas vaginalis (strain ATCC PRA-98 / G3) TaxID=412133 RepID=A2E0U0_TRIV3|nr:rRNA processing [Trichomonas vaginalis G3]EAY13695.1 Pumilio-family RNA binding repeat containing protein [Trichomonas vaginalis G3]KAI5529605.1 rRNA processing [Trichomonas vaginalis G3]|eukprot:XP_001325918.1 Pumilio-family RNA binding repeat containing protein [Trichomonas vaginalis G3]